VADENTLVALGERLVAQVVELGIRGGGPLSTAVESAEQHLVTAMGDREERSAGSWPRTSGSPRRPAS